MPQVAAVRCCSLSGISCITPGGHNAEQYGECLKTATFEEAEGKCASINMRLCTLEELESNLCCGTGCEFDMKLTWHKRGITQANNTENPSVQQCLAMLIIQL